MGCIASRTQLGKSKRVANKDNSSCPFYSEKTKTGNIILMNPMKENAQTQIKTSAAHKKIKA